MFQLNNFAEVVRALAAVVALVLVVWLFLSSTLQGDPPNQTLIDMLLAILMAYFGGDGLAAISNRHINKNGG